MNKENFIKFINELNKEQQEKGYCTSVIAKMKKHNVGLFYSQLSKLLQSKKILVLLNKKTGYWIYNAANLKSITIEEILGSLTYEIPEGNLESWLKKYSGIDEKLKNEQSVKSISVEYGITPTTVYKIQKALGIKCNSTKSKKTIKEDNDVLNDILNELKKLNKKIDLLID